MNKDSFINKIRIKSSFDKQTAESVFSVTFDEIKKSVIKKKFLLIDEIGFFSVKHREMKTIIDGNKKAEFLLPPKDKLVFKPSETFINKLKD